MDSAQPLIFFVANKILKQRTTLEKNAISKTDQTS